MLGKLIKHEFRATARTMLPVLGIMAALALLANFSARFGDELFNRYKLAAVLFILIVGAAFIAVIVAEVMSIVVMVLRFYRNLLGDEGYLMHTLPTNVHALVWSKLIVSLVWFVATNLLILLLGMLTVFNLNDLNVGELFSNFPSLAEIRNGFAQIGVSMGDLWLLAAEFIVSILVGMLVTCLHFYASMSLGHMFAKDKILLSVAFFIGFNMLFSILGSLLGVGGMDALTRYFDVSIDSFAEGIHMMQTVFGVMLGLSLAEGAIFYIATALGLKKGLNLA